MRALGKLLAASAGVFVTLILGWIGIGWLWPGRETVGAIVIILLGFGVLGAAARVAQSVWKGEKMKFWWLE